MSKKKKTILIVGIIAVVLIAIAAMIVKVLRSVASTVSSSLEGGTPVQELALRDLSSAIYANGIVESQNKVSVTTELTGQIKELYVQLGDHVEAGTPLLVMDDTEIRSKIKELEKQLSQQDILAAKQKEINQRSLKYAKEEQSQTLSEAQTAVDRAQSGVNQAQAALNSAKETYNTYASSEEPDEAILSQLKAAQDEAQTAADTASSALDEAKSAYSAAVRSTNQAIQSAQDAIDTQDVSTEQDSTATSTLADLYSQLEKVTITAPSSGIITSLNVSTGSMVTNGDLMVIEDNQNLKLTVTIPENDILKVSSGMHATIKADALEDTEISGTVSKVINFASSSLSGGAQEGMGTGSSGSYSAEILIEGETKLLLGMNAKAEIILAEKKDALSVAYDCIVTEDTDKPYVFRAKEKDGTYVVEKITVSIGEEGDYYTEILSDKLKEGDYIIYDPASVNEGDTIQVDPEYIVE